MNQIKEIMPKVVESIPTVSNYKVDANACDILGKSNPVIEVKPLTIDSNAYMISFREAFIADTYVDMVVGGRVNFSEIADLVNEKYCCKLTPQIIKYWIERERTHRYILDRLKARMEVNGFKIEDWERVGMEVLKGSRKMDMVQLGVWKELGRVKGVGSQEKGINLNQQFIITQKDGSI